MTWKISYQKVKNFVSELNFWIRFGIYITPLIVVFLIWGRGVFFPFIWENIQALWLVVLSASILLLLAWTWRLRQQLLGGYRDNFRDLDGWDYQGAGWRVKNGELSVEGSIGFTMIGVQWENYTFTFKAKIIDRCLGVIVRASDQNNFYMLQIKPDKIRPHRLVAVPDVVNDERSAEIKEKSSQLYISKHVLTWITEHNCREFKSIPITLTLNDWFDVKIIVRGQSLNLSIGENFEREWPSILQIPTGKVGFRNAGKEKASVKDVRVTLLI